MFNITAERAAAWFEARAAQTPMPGAHEMFKMAAVAFREKAEREDPKPLTFEELQKMVGEPVWTVGVSFNDGTWAGWDIIENVDDRGIDFGFSTESAEWWSYNLCDSDGKLLGCAWCAYRHKPKDVTDINVGNK